MCSENQNPTDTTTISTGEAGASTASFTVTGMTCGHCVASVTEGVQEIVAGVTDVEVDLASGALTLTSDQPVSDAEVKRAVEEAGYQLA